MSDIFVHENPCCEETKLSRLGTAQAQDEHTECDCNTNDISITTISMHTNKKCSHVFKY